MRDGTTGHELASFSFGQTWSQATSADGRFTLFAGVELRLLEASTGAKLRGFRGHTQPVYRAAFSSDGRYILSESYDNSQKLWETATGKELASFAMDGRSSRWIYSEDRISYIAQNQFRGEGSAVPLKFTADAMQYSSSAFLPVNSRLAVFGGNDGLLHMWDVKTGRELARMVDMPSGEWLAITPEGFFSGQGRDAATVTIVRGVEETAIGQVHQSLFNPDLIREALAGDPDGEVIRAAQVINLDKVLDAGPPPAIADNFTSARQQVHQRPRNRLSARYRSR